MEIHNLRNQYKEKIQKAKQNLFHKLRFLNKIDQQFTQIGGSGQLLLKDEPENKPKPVILTNTTQFRAEVPFGINFNQDGILMNTSTNMPIRVNGVQLLKKEEMLFFEDAPDKPLKMLKNGQIVTESGEQLKPDGTNDVLEINVEGDCTEGFTEILLKLAANDTLISQIEEEITKKMQGKSEMIDRLEKELAKCKSQDPNKCLDLEEKIKKLKAELEKIKKCSDEKEQAMKELKQKIETQNANLARISENLDQQ